MGTKIKTAAKLKVKAVTPKPPVKKPINPDSSGGGFPTPKK